MFCYVDIETLPSADEALIADIAATVTPPRTMSKPETIARWEAEDKPALVDEAVRKTALDGSFGRCLAIAYAFDDAAPQVFIGDNERGVLAGFFIAVQDQARITNHGGEFERDIIFVGHNVAGFDLRFLWQRAVVQGMKPPICIRRAAFAKPWGKELDDTMMIWNPERDRRISMDKLCRALSIPSPKGDLDGASVFDAWKKGELPRIEAYCREEIRALRACHRRLLFLDVAEQQVQTRGIAA